MQFHLMVVSIFLKTCLKDHGDSSSRLLERRVLLVCMFRSCDNILKNCFFQISSYSSAYVRIIYEKTKGQVPLGPLLGKQRSQEKSIANAPPVDHQKWNKPT